MVVNRLGNVIASETHTHIAYALKSFSRTAGCHIVEVDIEKHIRFATILQHQEIEKRFSFSKEV